VCYTDSAFSREKLWTVEKVDGIKNISLTCVLHRFGLFQEETVHGGESGWYKNISLSLVLYCVLH